MMNYRNPYERSRHNKNSNWQADDPQYRAGNDGNRDQYDDYPRFGGRSRWGKQYDDEDDYGRRMERYPSRDMNQGLSGDRWAGMSHGYGSYSEDDDDYGTGYNSGYYGNYNNHDHNEGRQAFRQGNEHRTNFGNTEGYRRQAFSNRDNSYRGEFGDSRDYMREGRYRNDNRNEHQRESRDWWDRTSDEVASWFGDDAAERRRRMDKMREGEHRGRGPKGYKRSDDRMREDINDRLADDPWVDASDVEVTVTDGEVTLTGNVHEKLAKRRAEDIAEAVSGVRHVENRLRIMNSNTQYRNSSFNTDL